MSVVLKTKPAVEPDESVLQIDEQRLDWEWARQTNLFFKFALALVDAKARLDVARSNLDLVEAEIATDIRKNPQNYKVKKLTEGVIKELIPIQPEYKQALKKMHNRKHEAEVLNVMVQALDTKKKSLENLVGLMGMEYHSAPKAPNGMEKITSEYEKKHARKKLKAGQGLLRKSNAQ